MNKRNFVILLCLIFCFSQATSQISPGKLFAGHADLEGISNCFKCHEIGSKVSDAKCLDCHKAIKKRIDADKGYHSSKEVKGTSCAKCHNDHHGRNFKIINFDADNFEHGLTGYKLEGAHKKPDCRDCHAADKIKDPDIKNKSKSFLGLETKCLTCHEDYHQKTLDNDCMKCHGMDKFSPASGFDHEKTEYPLRGSHKTVDCVKCHKKEIKNGIEFQKFSGITHVSCNNCHTDVHQGRLGTDCIQCHSESSFNTLNGRFNHNTTKYPLEGKHKTINCKDCHKNSNDVATIFQEFIHADLNQCLTCHTDIHEGKFGKKCTECHSVQSFKLNGTGRSFDHNLTAFELVGKHTSLDCKKCHSDQLTDPVAHNKCLDCHEDFHQGEFTKNKNEGDCINCHNENGFSPSTFTIDLHQVSKFPLEGAHVATPCIFCHQKDEKWVFRKLGSRCVDCHTDIHEEYLDKRFYPDADCKNCHSVASWNEPEFEHENTSFPLRGKHKLTDCRNCHVADNKESFTATIPVFKVSSFCADCHSDQHQDQFHDTSLKTDCSRCHESLNWEAVNFNHDSTRFVLEGRHRDIDCSKCHYSVQGNGRSYILYKLDKFECSDCH